MRGSTLGRTAPVSTILKGPRKPALSRSDRLIRGWIVAAGANILGAASHGLAGGNLPHPLLWLLCTALSALVCVALAGRRLPRLGMAASVVLSQGLLHFLYMSTGSVAQVSAAHTHHGLPAGAALGHPAMAQHHDLSWQMVALHLGAALITFLMLRRGEQLSEKIEHAFRRELRAWFVLPALPMIPRIPKLMAQRPSAISQIQQVLSDVRVVRGPPIVIASFSTLH